MEHTDDDDDDDGDENFGVEAAPDVGADEYPAVGEYGVGGRKKVSVYFVVEFGPV